MVQRKSHLDESSSVVDDYHARFEEYQDNVEDNFDESEEQIALTYSITSYGADYPVDALVKRLIAGDIFVPHFQRGYVWTLPQGSRFIESLLLGLPVPGVFLSAEASTRKHLIIDGHQRLWTLRSFYEGTVPGKDAVFALKGLKSEFEGLTYKKLSEEHRRKLDDSIIHATIVRQDEPSDDDSSIYYIFERLNTGGVFLVPHEIRACVYHGAFYDTLRHLNENKQWRDIFGRVSKRMRDQELILRFLALFDWSDRYQRPMKEFLNKYMGKYRNLSDDLQDEVGLRFTSAIATIHATLGNQAFKPRRALNAAIFDAVMVGVAKRLEQGPIKDTKGLRGAYEILLATDEFKAMTESRTTDEPIVKGRVSAAIAAFAGIA